MVCNLCRRETDQLVRLGVWRVCQSCSTHDVLQRAIEAEGQLTNLRELVNKTKMEQADDVQMRLAAEGKLEAALNELHTAITILVPLVEEGARSAQRARDAVQELKKYEGGG